MDGHHTFAALLWLIMVGMDPAEAKSRGILGVMADQRPESPEEQYDRLVRTPAKCGCACCSFRFFTKRLLNVTE